MPLYREYRIGPHPSMPPGCVIVADEKPGKETSEFSWFIWAKGEHDIFGAVTRRVEICYEDITGATRCSH
jgi:hypothetical protein